MLLAVWYVTAGFVYACTPGGKTETMYSCPRQFLNTADISESM